MTTNKTKYPPGSKVRVGAIVGNPRKGIVGLLPISRSTWLNWARKGIVPKGEKIGAGTVVWKIEDVLAAGSKVAEE